MVGHLHLQTMDDSLKGKNREGLLDSPDSGLAPSPGPPFCSPSPGLTESRSGSCPTPVESQPGCYRRENREGKLLPYLSPNSAGTESKVRMHPVFYGESIEVDPNPEREVSCNSEVRYDSDRHHRDGVCCAPFPTPTAFSETVVAVRNCTWRRYRTQVYLEPRQRPVKYQSTTIVYPKRAKNVYRTTLSYSAPGCRRWFVSTVQLESSRDSGPCMVYMEDL
ncbi:refilin-A [Cynoglossus semilaevis]|uniref:Refilin A n=1 Tax=Cynoglossus semilaevis TaxID=244447 RepID=A0A3P8WPH2_CYNSE|nr:refilin-A-like [Cynoglossus semilaevis]